MAVEEGRVRKERGRENRSAETSRGQHRENSTENTREQRRNSTRTRKETKRKIQRRKIKHPAGQTPLFGAALTYEGVDLDGVALEAPESAAQAAGLLAAAVEVRHVDVHSQLVPAQPQTDSGQRLD
eukprot:3161502-Rhodomonas_salina.1